MHENGCPWHEHTCEFAAANGQLECLIYSHENGCIWNLTLKTCSDAASNGYLEILKYARENGCSWDSTTTDAAALNGHLDCLKYAHEEDCIWHPSTCANAAKNGHLDCLKYAHEEGCDWYSDTCANAARYNHLECLKYAVSENCDLDIDVMNDAIAGGDVEIIRYLLSQDCPWDEEVLYTDYGSDFKDLFVDLYKEKHGDYGDPDDYQHLDESEIWWKQDGWENYATSKDYLSYYNFQFDNGFSTFFHEHNFEKISDQAFDNYIKLNLNKMTLDTISHDRTFEAYDDGYNAAKKILDSCFNSFKNGFNEALQDYNCKVVKEIKSNDDKRYVQCI